MYAQLDINAQGQTYKRVILIGGEEVGIVPILIKQYPDCFIDLEGRENVPEDEFDWYYDVANDLFITTADLPVTEPDTTEVTTPHTNDEIYENQLTIMSAIADEQDTLITVEDNEMTIMSAIADVVDMLDSSSTNSSSTEEGTTT